jgi:hypothetical protein
MTITHTFAGSPPDHRIQALDGLRRRALERLYKRKAAVDELIDSLENYQRCRETKPGVCIEISAVQRCS